MNRLALQVVLLVAQAIVSLLRLLVSFDGSPSTMSNVSRHGGPRWFRERNDAPSKFRSFSTEAWLHYPLKNGLNQKPCTQEEQEKKLSSICLYWPARYWYPLSPISQFDQFVCVCVISFGEKKWCNHSIKKMFQICCLQRPRLLAVLSSSHERPSRWIWVRPHEPVHGTPQFWYRFGFGKWDPGYFREI